MEPDIDPGILAALLLSFIICYLIWPKKKVSYKDYIDVLDSKTWKNWDQIYTEVRKRSKKPISENEHEHNLLDLESKGAIEKRGVQSQNSRGNDLRNNCSL